MTVGELIRLLGEFDPNLLVLVVGYEGGYDGVHDPETVHVYDGPISDYHGRYTDAASRSDGDPEPFDAVVVK